VGFDFSQINLIPRKCIVNSRSECDTTVKFGNGVFQLPVVPANMECVMNDEIAIKLAQNNFFYIHHRFNVDVLEFTKKMRALNLPVSISIGVNEDAYKIVDVLMSNQELGIDYVTIDIAHGHCEKMEKIIKYIKTFESSPFIIAGNVSTPEAVRDLESWGANAIKVGIGPGAACTTYVATGFGSRGSQASTVKICSEARNNSDTKIIADGGIKEPGDIAKSLVLGADMVMIGGMFSALNDSPGPTVSGTDGRLYKEFWGSASAFQSGKKQRIEGTKKLMLMKHHGILDEMSYLKECLQSAISYGGGDSLNCFKYVNYLEKV
jgi:GMP reductase